MKIHQAGGDDSGEGMKLMNGGTRSKREGRRKDSSPPRRSSHMSGVSGQTLLLIRGTVKKTLFSPSCLPSVREIGDYSFLHVRSLRYGSNSARRREKRRDSWVVVPSPLLFLGAVKGAASVGGQGLLLFSVLGLLLLLSQLHIPLCL